MNELAELLKELERDRFYGSIEVKFEAGAVTLIRRTETINPRARAASPNNYRGNRGSHEHNTSR